MTHVKVRTAFEADIENLELQHTSGFFTTVMVDLATLFK